MKNITFAILSCLPLALIPNAIQAQGLKSYAVSGNSTANSVPIKTIEIYNNSSEVIFPVIEASESQQDMWLQAYFKVTNVTQDTYAHTKVYRIYVNPARGIPAHGSVSITLPFYSTLTPNPVANLPDQYIDWWNGARVYLYDTPQNLQLAYNAD